MSDRSYRKEERIKLEHGSGGKLSRDLIEQVIYPTLKNNYYTGLNDAALLKVDGQILFTTDTFVVDPPFFPGSDIGKLAVYGTCNDLSVSGAQPKYLSLGFVLEEGFSIDDLERILTSIAEAAEKAGVAIVTGDTKVVPKGKGGEIYINSAGIGEKIFPHLLSTDRIVPGDAVIVTSTIGEHGIAVMAAREGLNVAESLVSDCTDLFPVCRTFFNRQQEVRFLRDATRGGVSAVLNEIASDINGGIVINEEVLPVRPRVKTVSDILGLNPLEVANEGVVVAVVSSECCEMLLADLRKLPLAEKAVKIGTIVEDHPKKVVLQTEIGGRRILDFPRGLLLPRIC